MNPVIALVHTMSPISLIAAFTGAMIPIIKWECILQIHLICLLLLATHPQWLKSFIVVSCHDWKFLCEALEECLK